MNKSHTFYTFAQTAQKIRETRGSNTKIAICARYFLQIDEPEYLQLAAQFLSEGAFSAVSGHRTGIGSRTISTCAADFCDIDYEAVFKPCRYATGSASEAIEKLMHNTHAGRTNRTPQAIELTEIKNFYQAIRKAKNREEKQNLLRTIWKKMTPVEIKYLIRIMSRGSLRIGFEKKSVIASLAKAFDKPREKVRYTHMITGSISKTTKMCFLNCLDKATFTLYQPLAFMLASPVESRVLHNYDAYVAEEKFDGMRCQLHAGPNDIKLFSRDLNDITPGFPELATAYQSKQLPEVVLDGEICVFKNQRIQPFQLLQKRIGRKKPSAHIVKELPVIFVAFDLLYIDGTPLFNETLEQRRHQLFVLCRQYHIPCSRQFSIKNREDVETLFNRALEHGNEGLMLKKKESVYEYGQRRKSWLKVKKPGGTLDTVIMYAHSGTGKRGGYYSDFTLGIRVADDERYEEEFIPIGKAYGGYTDEEMKQLNTVIKKLAVEKYGPTLGLIPDIVVELEFDDIQVNKRTKANFTLRLPRFKAIRWDLAPEDADTLRHVEQLYQQKIEQERRPQTENPSIILPDLSKI